MTQARDIERVLEHWLDDGIDQMPDRVYLSILDRVERQPQQRPWRVLWRDSHVSTYFKPLLAVAAAVAIAVAGITLFAQPSGSGVGGPTPSTSPSPSATPSIAPSPIASASPSTSPSASVAFPAWFTAGGDGAGILPAGSQTTRRFVSASTFTVPGRWVNESDNAEIYTLFPDTPANEAEYALTKGTAQNVILAETVENNMFAICEATGLFHGTTAADVIDGLAANDKLSTTEPVEVTISGLSGRRIDVQLSPDWSGKCPPGPDAPPTRDYKDARSRIIMLDTPDGGSIGIAISSLYSSQFEGFLAEAMPIVESFQFRTGQ